jgi:hypothetical protein
MSVPTKNTIEPKYSTCAMFVCLQVIRYGFFALKEAFGSPPYFSTWLRWVGGGHVFWGRRTCVCGGGGIIRGVDFWGRDPSGQSTGA